MYPGPVPLSRRFGWLRTLLIGALITLTAGAAVGQTVRAKKRPSLLLRGELALLGGWDSNVLRRDESIDRQGAGVLRVVPRLFLHTPRAKTVRFTLDVLADIRVNLPAGETLSVSDASGVDGDARLTVLARGPVSITLADRFSRSAEPDDRGLTFPYTHFVNRFTAEIAAFDPSRRPTRAPVDGGLAYDFSARTYDAAPEADRMEHTLRADLTWHFARRGRLFAQADWTAVRWMDHPREEAVFDYQPLEAQLGVSGYMTRGYHGSLSVGYADTFAAPGMERLQTVVGAADMGWTIGDFGEIGFGFERELQVSVWSGWSVHNTGWLRMRFEVAPVVLRVEGSWIPMSFGQYAPSAVGHVVSHSQRTGEIWAADFDLRVQVLEWLRVDVRYELDRVLSNFRNQIIRPTTSDISSRLTIWNYVRHQVVVGVAATL